MRVFGITHDITDLQVVSRNYQRERDLSRAILNSLQEGYLLTRDAVIVEVNGAFCALTGYSAAELVGTSQPFPFWADDGPTSLPELIRRLRTEGGGRADVKLRHRDGGTLDAHVTSTPLADDALASGMWLSVFRDISEQRRYERLLLSRAQTDPLTGLQNSRTFRDRLRQAADRASAAEPLSLALLDLDHFKRINDTHGHAVGDEVLCAVVERVVEVTGEQYPWARIGGEEFALLMPETPLPAARRLVDAALSALRRSPLPAVGAVTASAGVAELTRPADDDRLFRQADALLYQAKAAGRDQLCSQV